MGEGVLNPIPNIGTLLIVRNRLLYFLFIWGNNEKAFRTLVVGDAFFIEQIWFFPEIREIIILRERKNEKI
ncbi:hypothetical protein J2Z37_004954 [Ammoniphilus resinae]|uniref:Uncharacterized protein n=1 Tax=Ammoniphilus resinae TaxID=861532 RepID=A0ABS4GXE2_9BACL|nr:hypothetical protein [Ammoniphilus resinae]